MIERRLPLFLKFIATVFALGYAITSSAQATIPHRVLNMENGLPSNEVYCITQDANGTMWMGTDMGLVKYDGLEPKVFIPSTKSSITVLRLYVDYDNRVWLSTYRNGLFYVEDDSLIEPKFNAMLVKHMRETSQSFVMSMSVDSNDEITLALNVQHRMIITCALGSTGINKNQLKAQSKERSIFYLEQKGQSLVYGISLDTMMLDESAQKNDKWREMRFLNVPVLNSYRYGVIDGGSIAWSGNGIYTLGQQRDSVLLEEDVTHILHDQTDYYVSTTKGIYHYKDYISTKTLNGVYFQDYFIARVFRDEEGIFWITTVGNGTMIVPSFKSTSLKLPVSSHFSKYYGSFFMRNDTLNVLDNNELYIIHSNGSKLFYNELKITEHRDNRVKIKWLGNAKAVLVYLLKYPDFAVNRLTKDHYGGLAIGESVIVSTENYSRYLNDVESSLTGDSIYLLTAKGIDILVQNQFVHSSHRHFQKDVKCLLKLNNAELLIGASDGLYLFNLEKLTSKHLFPDQLNGVITCLEENEDGLVFIGTRGSGLGVYDGQELQMISTGLHNDENTINQIVCKGRNVWLRTQKEIMLLRQKADSDSFVQLHLPSAFIGADYVNTLLFSNNKPVLLHDDRLVYFDTAVLNYPFSNSFSVSSLSVNDEQYAPDDFANLDLAYDDNNLGVGLKLHTLHQAKENKIAYRLLGQDDKWVITDEKKIRFLGLQSGDYKLQVRAENAIGAWSEPRDVIQFTIQKHFAQTALFKLGVVLGLLVIFGAAFFIGKSVTNREKLLLQANITALKRQINPHFILNALNGIRYYQSEKDFKKADEYILKLAELLRNIVYSTDNKRVRLSDEMKRIESYVSLEKMRFEGGFSFAINNLNEVDYSKVFIPPMLLQPIIENAIKHGLSRVDEPALELTIAKKNNTLIITIKDNGPGIAGDEIAQINRSQSIGISNTRNRIDLIRKLEKKQISMEIVSNGGLEVMIKVEQ
jgi:ligand-binding sensor domain-containing protein/two-component sensor histidine kinase